jgi:AraC-like DNA-binding protein
MNKASIILNILIILFTSISYLSAVPVRGFIHIDDPYKKYDISGEWKFQHGDDIRWADPAFDDSMWEIKKIPSPISIFSGKRHTGWFWVRLHFTINEEIIKNKPLFISIFRAFHAYEIYLNGKIIGSRGILPDKSGKWKWTIGGFSKICSQQEVSADKDNVLALRIYCKDNAIVDSTIVNYGAIESYNLGSNYFLILSIITYILSAIFLFIGIYHLFVFSRRENKINLWYALFMITLSTIYVLLWLPEMLDSPDTQHIAILFFCSIQLHFIWFIKFLLSFAEDFLGKFRSFFNLIIALILISICAIIVTRSFTLINYIFISMLLLVILVSTPTLIFLLFTEIKSKNYKIIPVVAGAAIGIASITVDILQTFGLHIINTSGYFPLLTPVGNFIFAVSISFSIGIRYSNSVPVTLGKRCERKQSFLKGIDTETLQSQLTVLMEKDKIFYDETLTINKLAQMLDLSIHQLSEFLNEKMNMNYNTYVNKYRIEEAIRYLTEEPDSSITSIAFKVGFNSNSRFYTAFKKHTGKIPKDFRK